MKPPLSIGIVGGMSPESTVTYYQRIIQKHLEEFGDHTYPRIIMASVSFQKYIDWQHDGSWDKIAAGLQSEFDSLAAAGAQIAGLATNTMHKVLPQINCPLQILSIMEALANYARSRGISHVAVTGTKFTMSDGFYAEALSELGLLVSIPTPEEQTEIHRIIYEELISGNVLPESVETFTSICRALLERGAQAVILGCTELELLMRGSQADLPLIDSAQVHAEALWNLSITV